MNLALGVVFLWAAAACFFVAGHGLGAASPWEGYKAIMQAIREAGEEGGTIRRATEA